MSTDRKDNIAGLGARDDLLYVADRWPRLSALLAGHGGNALTGLPGAVAVTPPLVIDVAVLDLMREIEDSARFYGQILADETDWVPVTSSMPGLLADVARRYGHFVAPADRMALDFMDDAHQFRAKVEKALDRTAPPVYVGPCRTHECVGELYIREDQEGGSCRVCGESFSVLEQRSFILGQFQERLMTPAEISRALKVLGHSIAVGSIYNWTARGKLVAAEDGLYSLADAKALAEKGRVAA